MSTGYPFYILFSHSTLSSAPTNTLGHPKIQYHYADDSPLHILPRQQEHVLLMDCQSDPTSHPPVRSFSQSIAVTGIKVEEAIAVDGRNERMYIIETVDTPDSEDTEISDKSPREILADFKQKNAVLRRALHYPETLSHKAVDPSALSPTSPLPISPGF